MDTHGDSVKELIRAIQRHNLDYAVELLNSSLYADLLNTVYVHKQSSGIGDVLCKYEDTLYCINAVSRADFSKPFSIIESIKRASGIAQHPFYTHTQIPEYWNKSQLWSVSKFIHNCTQDLDKLRAAMRAGKPLVIP